MEETQSPNCRVDVLIGTLIYMMTVYQRSRRRDVALSIAAHLDLLAHHPEVDDTVRRVANGMRAEWERSLPPLVPAQDRGTVH